MAKKEKKVKGPEHVGFKDIFGITALSTNEGLSAIFMSTMFMNFMTDYAGLGAWGATLATTLLRLKFVLSILPNRPPTPKLSKSKPSVS